MKFLVPESFEPPGCEIAPKILSLFIFFNFHVEVNNHEKH